MQRCVIKHMKYNQYFIVTLNGWEYQTSLLISWETCMQVKKQQLELDMEQLTSSKLENEYDNAVYCHPAYVTYMQNTSCEISAWMNHKLESRLLEEIQQPQIYRYHSNGRKWRITKKPLNEGNRWVKKLALNLAFKTLKSWHLISSLHDK